MDSLTGKIANLDAANPSLFVIPASEVRSRKVSDSSSAMRELGATIVGVEFLAINYGDGPLIFTAPHQWSPVRDGFTARSQS